MKNRASGFTLMEVIITTILVGVIATLALVSYGGVIEKQRAKEGEQILQAIFANVLRVRVETGSIANVILGGVDPFVVNMQPSQNFQPVVVTNNILTTGDLTYSITRNAPIAYTLQIIISNTTTTPVITCAGGPAGICARIRD